MKATEKAYRTLEVILITNGLRLEEGFCGKQVTGSEYVGYQVWERHDSYEGGTIHGHIEVTAAISRMGGNMNAEDFAKAAAEMQTARDVLAELAGADLSYTADTRGEEVA